MKDGPAQPIREEITNDIIREGLYKGFLLIVNPTFYSELGDIPMELTHNEIGGWNVIPLSQRIMVIVDFSFKPNEVTLLEFK